MSHSRVIFSRILPALMVFAGAVSLAADNKQPPAGHARIPVPAVTNEYIHQEFGDNCTLLPEYPQYVGDLDDDGIDDLVVAARCKNPMADQAEYGFRVTDPYDSYLGFGSNVKTTSAFASDVPERKGVVLLIVHGVGPQAWRSDKAKPKFLLINLPFKTLAVKRLALNKKKTVLGIYMEEDGEGEQSSSVLYWDGRKYRYQLLGPTME